MKNNITPFDNCPALDGYHCQTNSLAKIFNFYQNPLSEDMIFGLGAGLGFVYWFPKEGVPFIGGRGNTKSFFSDIASGTGIAIEVKSTTSPKKAERTLIDKLEKKEPIMLYGDMGFLPWFEFPEEYHFGGHTFVVCGYDGDSAVLVSDMEPKTIGLKKGFYFEVPLEKLARARSSEYKPFPPKNTYLEFDFSSYRMPTAEDIFRPIRRTTETMLFPHISNMGVRGLRRTAREILKWPDLFDEKTLALNLFNIYISIEVGGTGGGCFRYMYSRFLEQAATLLSDESLGEAAKMFDDSGKLFSRIARLFANTGEPCDIPDTIQKASQLFHDIADKEEMAFGFLSEEIPRMI